MSELVLRAGTWEHVTPESAGWRYLHFGVREGTFSAETGDVEIAVVPLGGRCRVEADGDVWEFGGREHVFAGMPWALYLPRDTRYRVEAEGEIAICGARCDTRREPVLVRPEQVQVEVRGAGNATRQINHILKPEFPAERLLVVEVFTPSGNWSSYPPHKHDEDDAPGEVVLEETYYFRTCAPEAFAVQRLYSPRHGLDVTETVGDGDLMLVPYGYHTTAAAHGYDLYYLNALAGDTRSMASADDPALHWVRAAWAELDPDPPRAPRSVTRVANAPVSYGAFELTVGVLPYVPGPEQVLDAIAAAGYEGTELGPLGYLGAGEKLRERLRRRGLWLAGAFVELRFGDGDLVPLEVTLDLLEGFDAQPILCDKGPRDGDVDLDGVARAVELARARGFEPSFHHHMGTRVQNQVEIERLLESTDVALLLDSGHLTAAGGDPVQAVSDWRERVAHVHVKDVRLAVLEQASRWEDAWRGGAFCELGSGDVDLAGFFERLAGYSGWIVVEQDWVPVPDRSGANGLAAQIEAQARNRRWLAEHARL